MTLELHTDAERELALSMGLVRGIVNTWQRHCDLAGTRVPAPPDFGGLIRRLILAAGDPAVEWPPRRRELLRLLTILARSCEASLYNRGEIVNCEEPGGFKWIDLACQVAAVWDESEQAEDDGSDTEGAVEEVGELVSLQDLIQGDFPPDAIANHYHWLSADGSPDVDRVRQAVADFLAGKPVKRPSAYKIVRTPVGLIEVRHPGAVQYVRDLLLQLEEQPTIAGMPKRIVVGCTTEFPNLERLPNGR